MRMMVPPLVGQYIILIKHTSIGGVVGLDELLRRTVILYNGFQNPAQALVVVAIIYFSFLYPLSILSRRLELKDPRAATAEGDESFLDRLRLGVKRTPAGDEPPDPKRAIHGQAI
jgi:polar amino acid transport system permease protein